VVTLSLFHPRDPLVTPPQSFLVHSFSISYDLRTVTTCLQSSFLSLSCKGVRVSWLCMWLRVTGNIWTHRTVVRSCVPEGSRSNTPTCRSLKYYKISVNRKSELKITCRFLGLDWIEFKCFFFFIRSNLNLWLTACSGKKVQYDRKQQNGEIMHVQVYS
jgi:hypothetical protein